VGDRALEYIRQPHYLPLVNIAWGCVKASPGCDHCYAESWAKRYGWGWGPGAKRHILSPAYWAQPLKWDAAAKEAGERHRVFCSSMTDVFLNDPLIDQEREKLWPLIRQTPNLDWLLLTKHPERFKANLPDDWGGGYPNVCLMVSVENNDAGWRVDALRKTPARARGLSVEPMLGDVDQVSFDGISWVILGGESGTGARPIEIASIRDAVAKAKRAHAKPFVKQLGAVWSRETGDGRHRDDPKGGDIERFAVDLRVREYPVIGAAA
jgi:protein gp37